MNFAHLLGNKGENLTAKYYKANGYKILERNYRVRAGEIDIIAQKGDMVVFIEVKTRSENAIASPAESVTRAKQRKLIAAAKAYMAEHKCEPFSRFDVAEVIDEKVNCIENAFTL